MKSFDVIGMRTALEEAEKALREDEVPVGAALFLGEKLLWADHNRREALNDPTAHAEMLCLKNGAAALGDWRLKDCTLYVTLEPCPMCAGAIVQARIPRVYIGAMNPKAGCAGSVLNILEEKGFNHQVETHRGLLGEECSAMLKEFFRELRKKKQEKDAQDPQDLQDLDNHN